MHMRSEMKTKRELNSKVAELQDQVDELKELVNTLLSVICEEPDGVHSGSAPSAPSNISQYAM